MGPAKSIALVVCDIDGTLVRHDKTLADASIAAFVRLRRADVQASLISARPPSGMLWLAEALDISLPLGAFNGGTLFRRDGAILSGTHLSASAARTAITLLADAKVDAWLFARGRWYARDADNPRVPRERLSTASSRRWSRTSETMPTARTRSSASARTARGSPPSRRASRRRWATR